MRAHFAAFGLLLLAGCVTVNAPPGSTSRSESAPRAAPDLGEAARVNTDLGMNYARTGELDVALDKFLRAIEQDDRYAPAHVGIAYVYSQRREPEKAETHYRRALSLQPDDPNTRNNFAVFLCGQQRYKDAEKLFMQAAKSSNYREPERAHTNAGVCARRIPDLDAAEAHFREALTLRSDFPEALQQLASLFLERKDYARAQAFLKRYEKVGPPTATTLWMGAKIEFALGDESAAANYAERLRAQFPESAESLNTQSPPAS